MRFSIGGHLNIVSEHGGKIEIDYRTSMLAKGESFHIFIDQKEEETFTFEHAETVTQQGLTVQEINTFEIDLKQGQHKIQISVQSEREDWVRSDVGNLNDWQDKVDNAKYLKEKGETPDNKWESENSVGTFSAEQIFELLNDSKGERLELTQSVAEVHITRIRIEGSNEGGAHECEKCPSGMISSEKNSHMCTSCPPGSQANIDQTECTLCKRTFFNSEHGGLCQQCPQYTHSLRHEDEEQFVNPETPDSFLGLGATYCEIEDEFLDPRANAFYRPSFFAASELCDQENDNYWQNPHLCAGKHIIGPISDLINIDDDREDFFAELFNEKLASGDFDDVVSNPKNFFDMEDDEAYKEALRAFFDDDELIPDDLDENFYVDADDLDDDLLYDPTMLINGEYLNYDSSDDENDENDEEDQADEGDGDRRNLKDLKKTWLKRQKHVETHEPIKYDKKEENLFFLSDNQYFSTTRFQYLQPHSPSRGYVFALFYQSEEVQADPIYSEAVKIKSKESLMSLNAETFVKDLQNFRILKNLGRQIYQVSTLTGKQTGYSVFYTHGDSCMKHPDRNYTSSVTYVCNPNSDKQLSDFPNFNEDPDYRGQSQCHFNIVWHTRLACSPCRKSDVTMSRGMCEANGMRTVHATRNVGANCVIDLENEGWSMKHGFGSHNGLFKFKGKQFVDKSAWIEECSMTNEMVEHPHVRMFLKVIASLFGVILCLLLCMCCKYQQVNSAYSKLKETTKQAVRIVQN